MILCVAPPQSIGIDTATQDPALLVEPVFSPEIPSMLNSRGLELAVV